MGATSQAELLKIRDVSEMLRLVHELHAHRSDPVALKRRLVQGVCQIIRADVGLCLVTGMGPDTTAGTVLSVVKGGPLPADAEFRGSPAAPIPTPTGKDTRGRRPIAGVEAKFYPGPLAKFVARPRPGSSDVAPDSARIDPATCNSSDLQTVREQAGMERCIDSYLPLVGIRLVAYLAVGRKARDPRRFTPRDRAVLDLLHIASAWIYETDSLRISGQDPTDVKRSRHAPATNPAPTAPTAPSAAQPLGVDAPSRKRRLLRQ